MLVPERFYELKWKSPEMFHMHNKLISLKCVYIPGNEHFSFAKIIHPLDRKCMLISWINSMIIIQLHLVLGTIKGNSKMCSFVTQHNATDLSSFEGACKWHADCRKVHQSGCQNLMLFSLPQATSNVVLENLAVRPTRLTTSYHVYGMWVSGLLISMFWTGCRMVEGRLWNGQAEATDNEHNCILSTPIWMPKNTVTRSWGP